MFLLDSVAVRYLLCVCYVLLLQVYFGRSIVHEHVRLYHFSLLDVEVNASTIMWIAEGASVKRVKLFSATTALPSLFHS